MHPMGHAAGCRSTRRAPKSPAFEISRLEPLCMMDVRVCFRYSREVSAEPERNMANGPRSQIGICLVSPRLEQPSRQRRQTGGENESSNNCTALPFCPLPCLLLLPCIDGGCAERVPVPVPGRVFVQPQRRNGGAETGACWMMLTILAHATGLAADYPFFPCPFCPWRPQRFHVQAGQPDMRVTVDESLRLVSPPVNTYLCNAATETLCCCWMCVLAQISRLVLSSARSWFFQLGLIRRWPGVLGDGQPGLSWSIAAAHRNAQPDRSRLSTRGRQKATASAKWGEMEAVWATLTPVLARGPLPMLSRALLSSRHGCAVLATRRRTRPPRAAQEKRPAVCSYEGGASHGHIDAPTAPAP
ncbi:hypothetical protein B0T11DRAFT_51394 [Plectosphaerella cucumerina]|uniref:Uncharacterized protein n=1 Tax=Plectosphaerella cucumerina TaxID=40658 RepID=A0A8K0TI98_9PEZI|nr:hypothetical protein B0T11DRAFT_51394 [Plectosphaerella cucumerina]